MSCFCRGLNYTAGLICAWVLLASPADATPESRAAVLFLLIEPGGRSVAMGGAFTAIADDATATFYNPAGLGQISRVAAHRYRTPWLPGLANDMFYEHRAITFGVPKVGTIGISQTVLDLGEQTRTDERGNVVGSFPSKDQALAISYGTKLNGLLPHGDLSVGFTVRRIESNLATTGAGIERGRSSGTAIATDIGILVQNLFLRTTSTKEFVELPSWLTIAPRQSTTLEDVVHLKDGQNYHGTIVEEIPGKSLIVETRGGSRFVVSLEDVEKVSRNQRTSTEVAASPYSKFLAHRTSRGLSIGLGVYNIGGEISYSGFSQADPLPRNVRLGLAYTPIDTDFLRALASLDIYKPIIAGSFGGGGGLVEDVHLGAEVTIAHLLSFRLGRFHDSDGDIDESRWGIGIGTEVFQLNYQSTESDYFQRSSPTWSLSVAF